MRERRFFGDFCDFGLSSSVTVSPSSESEFRRFPAVTSGYINGLTVPFFPTAILLNLFISCVCLWFQRVVDQSERVPFPLFILIMADKIRKHLQDISLGIEDEIVNLPFDLCEEAANETRFSLIVKPTNPRRQNLRAILSTMPRLWGVGEEVSGRILENKKIQFLFQSEESMLSVLRRGPWSFNDWMCVTQKWTPLHSDDDLKRIPFWVQVRGIPLNFLTHRMVTSIGENLGHFLETDFAGDGAVLVDYVRIRLLWHIDQPLRFQRLFQFGDETALLKFRYEKLRNFCSLCGLMTHDETECPLTDNSAPAPADDDEDDDDNPPDVPDAKLSPKDPAPAMKTETEEQTTSASKKRKTAPSSSQLPETPSQPQLVCYDMRHAIAVEETQEQVFKRRRGQSEVVEIRNWFALPTDGGFSTAATENGTQPTPTNNREGTVGQKPPEPGWIQRSGTAEAWKGPW